MVQRQAQGPCLSCRPDPPPLCPAPPARQAQHSGVGHPGAGVALLPHRRLGGLGGGWVRTAAAHLRVPCGSPALSQPYRPALGHPAAERQARVHQFQTSSSIPIFLLTSQVGGLGLTLTAGDRVIMWVGASWPMPQAGWGDGAMPQTIYVACAAGRDGLVRCGPALVLPPPTLLSSLPPSSCLQCGPRLEPLHRWLAAAA